MLRDWYARPARARTGSWQAYAIDPGAERLRSRSRQGAASPRSPDGRHRPAARGNGRIFPRPGFLRGRRMEHGRNVARQRRRPANACHAGGAPNAYLGFSAVRPGPSASETIVRGQGRALARVGAAARSGGRSRCFFSRRAARLPRRPLRPWRRKRRRRCGSRRRILPRRRSFAFRRCCEAMTMRFSSRHSRNSRGWRQMTRRPRRCPNPSRRTMAAYWRHPATGCRDHARCAA